MSKRHGSTSVVAYQEMGFLPEAIVNFLALLGWAPEGEEELFTLEELTEQFSLERVSKSPAVFDMEKLKWINGMYIRKASAERLLEYGLPYLKKAGYVDAEPTVEQMIWAMMTIDALKNYISCFSELPAIIDQYRDEIVDEIKANKEIIVTVMTAMKEKLEKVNTINSDTYQQILKEIRKETGYKGRNLFHSIRVAKTGEDHGPDLDKLAIVMGRDLMLERANEFLEFAETL